VVHGLPPSIGLHTDLLLFKNFIISAVKYLHIVSYRVVVNFMVSMWLSVAFLWKFRLVM